MRVAQANDLKVSEFLSHEDVVAFLASDSVRSLTFKADRYGTNISKAQAEQNSDEWYPIELEANVASIDNLPSSDIFDTETAASTPSEPSEAGSSASHAATPPSSGRGRGRGRGSQ